MTVLSNWSLVLCRILLVLAMDQSTLRLPMNDWLSKHFSLQMNFSGLHYKFWTSAGYAKSRSILIFWLENLLLLGCVTHVCCTQSSYILLHVPSIYAYYLWWCEGLCIHSQIKEHSAVFFLAEVHKWETYFIILSVQNMVFCFMVILSPRLGLLGNCLIHVSVNTALIYKFWSSR